MEHDFTPEIMKILAGRFRKAAPDIFNSSSLLQYLNIKTRAASRGSKSRASLGNLYAIYVVVEDYVKQNFHESKAYSSYAGARFSDLLARQRSLPFGGKLQNHPLNGRCNDEFRKYFPTSDLVPILRNLETQRYWVNENLLLVAKADKTYNIAPAILEILDAYIAAKTAAFENFIEDCRRIQSLSAGNAKKARDFVAELLRPNVDARVFEIVSYAILKAFYGSQSIFWGWKLDSIQEEYLVLFKTGRTNANDGGIDFVMRPLGRFFQVTETPDVKKYFLDIDKVQRFPLTFVVKSMDTADAISARLRQHAVDLYRVDQIVERYMGCVEEIINIPILLERFAAIVSAGRLSGVLNELITQSKVEFNYEEDAAR